MRAPEGTNPRCCCSAHAVYSALPSPLLLLSEVKPRAFGPIAGRLDRRELCHRQTVPPAARGSDAVLVRSFRPRMVCTVCGIVGADVRSNWREMKASGG